ncbi:hypothetical protein CPB86DRAFT_781658 [Serendipita vermifera]|nr:hypothetical protein CPB86DRAFT_781658 [Serendipita vermifera]
MAKFWSTLFERGAGQSIRRVPQLPAELWIIIIDFIDGKVDLYHLCRTSKLLRLIAERKLYELYFQYDCRWPPKMNIRSVLVHPQYEVLINTLYLQLDRWSFQSNGQVEPCRSPIDLDQGDSPCPCDRLDETLVTVLSGLLNLKLLRLLCTCCEARLYERHRYLATLQTRVLQEVRFDCTCSGVDEKKLMGYFGAPCMASVTSLGWCTPRGVNMNQDPIASLLCNSSILPNLRDLYHRGGKLNDLLLQYQAVSTDPRPLKAPNLSQLVQKRDKWVHISVQSIDKASPWLDRIVAEPFPFQNLQHLGAFQLTSPTCRGRRDELYTILRRLTALKNLTSVEARFTGPDCMGCPLFVSSHFGSDLPEFKSLFPHLHEICLLRIKEEFDVCDIWYFHENYTGVSRGHQMKPGGPKMWEY